MVTETYDGALYHAVPRGWGNGNELVACIELGRVYRLSKYRFLSPQKSIKLDIGSAHSVKAQIRRVKVELKRANIEVNNVYCQGQITLEKRIETTETNL